MRILGYIDHPYFKITVFQTDTRLSIKFENGRQEQVYKLRPDERCNSLREVRQLIDEEFLQAVEANFQGMEAGFQQAWNRHFPPEEEEFEVII